MTARHPSGYQVAEDNLTAYDCEPTLEADEDGGAWWQPDASQRPDPWADDPPAKPRQYAPIPDEPPF